jgi:tRNA threonylcarbamoyladenosine biosynthesis protein TsaB
MLTLAMDTATRTVGLALLDGEEILAEFYLNLGRHHAEVLLPAVDQICRLSGIELDRVALLACTTGPGSFTGVRIGVCTIKGLALATGKPVVGVSTLEALALNVMPYPAPVCPMLDARKNQVYTGLFRNGDNGLPEPILPESLCDIETFLKSLEGEVIFLGDGAVRYEKLIGEILPGRFILAGGRHQGVRATAVGLIAHHRYCEGVILDPLTFSPRYLRLSEAEVNRQESGGVGPGP